MLEQTLGWIGNALFFYGVFALADKRISGFYVNGLANLLYGIQAIITFNWSLLICSIGLIILNIYAILNWRKHES